MYFTPPSFPHRMDKSDPLSSNRIYSDLVVSLLTYLMWFLRSPASHRAEILVQSSVCMGGFILITKYHEIWCTS